MRLLLCIVLMSNWITVHCFIGCKNYWRSLGTTLVSVIAFGSSHYESPPAAASLATVP